MTVSTTSTNQTSQCNGATTSFPVAFQYLRATDLVVELIDDATGAATLLVDGVDYSRVGADPMAAPTSITTLTAYPAGKSIRRRRATVLEQTMQLIPGGPVPAAVMERAHDRHTLAQQEQRELLDDTTTRALLAPAGETPGPIPAATDRASRVLGFDAVGRPLAVANSQLAIAEDLAAAAEARAGAEEAEQDTDDIKYAVELLRDAVADDRAIVEARAGSGIARVFKTYAALAAVTGTASEGAIVLDGDVGTHTDPVVGGTVANGGNYIWSVSPPGWERVSDSTATMTAANAADAETAASVSAAEADAAAVVRDNLTAQLASSTEVVVPAAQGVNLNVSYAAIADGTAATAVGSPALVGAGKLWVTAGGVAVSEATTASNLPAILQHEPNYEGAITRVTYDLTGVTSGVSVRAGAMVSKQSDTTLLFFSYDNATGNVYFYKTASLTLRNTFAAVAPAGLTIVTLETRRISGGTYGCIVENGLTGQRYPEVVVTPTDVGNTTAPYVWTTGAATTQAGVKLMSVKVDTNRNSAVKRVETLEAAAKIGVPAVFQDGINQRTILNGRLLDVQGKDSEALYYERGAAAYNTALPGLAPTYRSWLTGTGVYEQIGGAGWASATFKMRNGIALASKGADAYTTGLKTAALVLPLPKNYIAKQGGVEISFSAYIPPQPATGAAVADVQAIFRFEQGTLPATDGPGAVRFVWSPLAVQLFVTHDDPTDSAEVTLFSHVFAVRDPGNRIVNCNVRLYGDKLIVAEVDGKIAAAYYWHDPIAADPARRPLRSLSKVGVAIDPKLINATRARITDLTIGPIPQAGSCQFRSAPPEPAPIVPNLVKQGVVYDALAVQHTVTAQVLGGSVVPMVDYAASLGIVPIDNFYLYISSDHATAPSPGGIWLLTGPTALGPWTVHAGPQAAGALYIDEVQGRQCEQPLVVYDDEANRLIMIYHNQAYYGIDRQRSIAATSPDGINWTRQGKCLDIGEGTDVPLSAAYINHDGYSSFWARDPLKKVPGWHGLWRISGGAGAGGGQSSLWSHARSLDGLKWTIDPRPILPASMQKHNFVPNEIAGLGLGAAPFAYHGQRLLPIFPFKAEAVGDAVGYLAIVRLGDDMRNMSAAEHIIPLDLPTEAVGLPFVTSTFVRPDGTLHIYYIMHGRYLHLITADLNEPPLGVTRPF